MLLCFRLWPNSGAEAWVTFWVLPACHGLAWSLPFQIFFGGFSPTTLWERWGESAGELISLCQLGDAPLLFFPPLLYVLHLWLELDFVGVAVYDLYSSLLEWHKPLAYASCLVGGALPLGLWHFYCNPRVMTDVVNVYPLLFLVTSALANGLALHLCAYRMLGRFASAVRWHEDTWTVWMVPLVVRMSRWGQAL